jgi:hypothetical protein
MTRAAAVGLAGVLLLGGAAPAAGQSQEPPVTRLLADLIAASAVIGPGETGDHRNHFVPGLETVGVVHELNRAIAIQAASFPLGPISAVVVSRGRPAEEAPLIGAGYTDSAFSIGANRMLFGVSYQTTTFDTFDDLDLRHNPINLYIPHAPAIGDESDRDMMHQVVSLRLNRKVIAFSLDYGWRNRIDVGIVLPIVQMAADARVTTHIVRTASSQRPAVHEFDIIDRGNRTFPRYCAPLEVPAVDLSSLQCNGSSTARGIGDIVGRAKVNLTGGSAGTVAFAVDVRLPTGNKDELIGLGALQVRPAVVVSVDGGRIGARARADYTWSDGELSDELAGRGGAINLDIPDEIGVSVGVDADIARRTTVAFDVIGRMITDLESFSTGTVVFPSRGPGALPSADFIGDEALRLDGTRDLTQIMASLGLRVDIPGGVVAQVNALFPVSKGSGLLPQPMAVFSLTKRY